MDVMKSFEPVYGHISADIAVLIANLFMCGFTLECLIRGIAEDESCEFPLYTFVGVQLGFIVVLQFGVPICVVGTLFILQMTWLLLGIMWYSSDSDCNEEAPYLNFCSKWLVLVYIGVVPFEFFWWMRMVLSKMPGDRKARNGIAFIIMTAGAPD
eukprot:g3219.t1